MTLSRRFGRYLLVSVLNVVLGVAVVTAAFGVLEWSAPAANLLGTTLVTPISYVLNRTWVWGRSGRSHLLSEALPFWAIAFLGLALSTWTAGYAERLGTQVTASRPAQTAVVVAVMLVTFGMLWAARFFVLHVILFADRVVGASSEVEAADAVA